MYIEQSIIDQIIILEDGQIQIRRVNKVFKDGIEISKTYHRHVLAPGNDLTGQDPKVINIANVVWTQDVIDAYEARQI